jgi:8-oxo-dGTP diphosphatase
MVPRTLIFIKKENNFLLIHKKKPESFGFNKLNGVGGHIEKGEEPFESAQREIEEETGLVVGGLDLCAILFIDINSIPGIQVFVFMADYKEGEFKHSEEGELCWMSFLEIQKSDEVVSDVPELIKVSEMHEPGAKPLIFKYNYDNSGVLRIVKC